MKTTIKETIHANGIEWECLHNPNFKRNDFDTFKKDAGTNAYTFSIKEWNEHLCGIGIITKSGRYGGGIFAHSDIALEFASWISPEFKLYIVKDYKRLKTDENSRLSLNFNSRQGQRDAPIDRRSGCRCR